MNILYGSVKNFFTFFVLVNIVFANISVLALDELDTLPKGINSPSIRMGYVDGLDGRFTPNGSLMTLNDINSIQFNVKTLKTIEPQISQLVSVLNNFGLKNYGDQLNLGTVHFDVLPNINYFAMVHAWGLTNRWSVGFGVPIVFYENHVSIKSQGSNINQFKKEFGGFSAEVDDAFSRLEVNLPQAVSSEISKRGYHPLESKKETIFGDIQAASIYQFYSTDLLKLAYKMSLNLPTGPHADPKDLLALDVFGQTHMENHLMASMIFWKGLMTINQRMGYRSHLPDRVYKIVSDNAADTLPDTSNEELVDRTIGDSQLLSGSINFNFFTAFSVGVGYEYQKKFSDTYHGNRFKNYQLLSMNTDSEIRRSRVGASYSTVQSYFAKLSAIPMLLNMEISDTYYGYNTPRQTLYELTWMLFY